MRVRRRGRDDGSDIDDPSTVLLVHMELQAIVGLCEAFEEQGLHRIQAGTLRHNLASQKVLERNGFVRFGLAEKYIQIAGVCMVFYELAILISPESFKPVDEVEEAIEHVHEEIPT